MKTKAELKSLLDDVVSILEDDELSPEDAVEELRDLLLEGSGEDEDE